MITTIKEIRDLGAGQRIHVRWSDWTPEEEHASYNHQTAEQECGLSASLLDMEDGDADLLRGIKQYGFGGATHCWIITGDIAGRGSDNERCLEIGTVRLLGEVHVDLWSVDWREVKIAEQLAWHTQRIEAAQRGLRELRSECEDLAVWRVAERMMAAWTSGLEIPAPLMFDGFALKRLMEPWIGSGWKGSRRLTALVGAEHAATMHEFGV